MKRYNPTFKGDLLFCLYNSNTLYTIINILKKIRKHSFGYNNMKFITSVFG